MPDPKESTPGRKPSSLRKGMERAAEWRREVEATLAAGDVDAAAGLILNAGMIPVWIRAERDPWIALLEAFVGAAGAGGPAAPRAAQAAASIAKDTDRQRGRLEDTQRARIAACKRALWQFVVTGAGLPAVPPVEELLAAAEVLYRGQLYKAAAAACRDLAEHEPNEDGHRLRSWDPLGARLAALCDRIELALELPNPRNRRDWLCELAHGRLWRCPQSYDPEPIPGEAAAPSNVLRFPAAAGAREDVN